MASLQVFTQPFRISRSSAALIFVVIGFVGLLAFHGRQARLAKAETFLPFNASEEEDNSLGTVNFEEQDQVQETTSQKPITKTPSVQEIVNYFEWTNCGACKIYFEFGGKVMKGNAMPGIDGQKAICMDPGLIPQPGNCIIYSMGVGYNWSFDDVMDEYGCDVFAFDPMVPNPFKNRKSTSRIRFYDTAFGVRDIEKNEQGWRVESLETIRKKLGHDDKIIDYLKFDIEGGEWDLLRSLIGSEQMDSVRQLSIEVHMPERNVTKLRQSMRILQELEDSGFVRFFARENVWNRFVLPGGIKGAACYEIAWFNKKFVKQ